MSEFRINSFHPDDWQRFKAIRLRALEEAPDAFGSTLERELAFTDEQWMERLKNPETATFVATATNGNDVGLAVGAPYEGLAGLFAMWVAPKARTMGIGRALVNAVCEWAKAEGHDRVRLDIANENAAAIALYKSMGFHPNGITGTHPPPREHIKEFQMEKQI